MFKPLYSEVKAAYLLRGYRFYSEGSYNLNIFGVRSNVSESNSFDDVIGVAYNNGKENVVEVFPATTDPGKYYLMNPLVSGGTLIMVAGQYKSAYKLGLHGRSRSNPYKALEQVRPMKYVRDNNRDSVVDISLIDNPNNHIVGNFKSNIHRAHTSLIAQWVGRYSAGCQVIQDPADFKRLIELCERSAATYGNGFTYTLFNEKDF